MMRDHLASLVEDFRRIGDETAVVLHRGNRRYPASYGELAMLAGRFAAELERRQIAPGERVAIWGQNSVEWMAAFFGCLLRGVIAVPLDAAGSATFAARVVADVAPKLIVGDRLLLDELAPGLKPSDLVEAVHGAEAPFFHPGATGSGQMLFFSTFEDLLPKQPLFAVSEAVDKDTPFQIVFTSGTTSEPKGIVHTHRNVLASLQPIENEIAKYRRYERFVHPLRFLHTLPLSHVFGQFMGLWIPAALAGEIHFETQLDPSRLIETIKRERISVLIAVPRVLELLRSHLLSKYPTLARELEEAKGLSIPKKFWKFRRIHNAFGWKFWAMICGGATLPPDLERFWSMIPVALIQGYGMTETAALVTLNHPMKIGRGTIGKPLPGREIKLGEDGEILVRGEMLSTASWQGGRLQAREQEWLATGDLAERSETGELRFAGRKGDAIVTAAGMNIHPADLEAAMMQQSGVRGCVVVGCDTPAGTEPVAVALFGGDDDELRSAVSRANATLAEYQQIRRSLRWPELSFPHTSTGKLLRRRVRDWATATIAGAQRSHAMAAQDDLLAWIASITREPVEQAADDARLSEDLHLDSLSRVQLQSTVEQELGVELDDEALAGIETLGQLRALLRQSLGEISPGESTAAHANAPEVEALPPRLEAKGDAPEHLYPHWPWAAPVRWLRIAFLELIARPLVWLLAAPRVVLETAVLPQGPLLLIANHVTSYDGALLLYALPWHLRTRVAAAMSGEMLLDYRKGRKQGNWFLNAVAPGAYWLLTALYNVFPLPRMRGFRRSFAHAGDAMDRGYSVLIFPEGHRSKDGTLQPFRPGIGLLALESGVPVLPIALKGLGAMRNERKWFRSGKLTIHVGEVVKFDETADADKIAKLLQEKLAAL